METTADWSHDDWVAAGDYLAMWQAMRPWSPWWSPLTLLDARYVPEFPMPDGSGSVVVVLGDTHGHRGIASLLPYARPTDFRGKARYCAHSRVTRLASRVPPLSLATPGTRFAVLEESTVDTYDVALTTLRIVLPGGLGLDFRPCGFDERAGEWFVYVQPPA